VILAVAACFLNEGISSLVLIGDVTFVSFVIPGENNLDLIDKVYCFLKLLKSTSPLFTHSPEAEFKVMLFNSLANTDLSAFANLTILDFNLD
jgi:hypothetical protein